MKLTQNYKIINNLKKLIKNKELVNPVKWAETCFDVEMQSFSVENIEYNLYIKASKKISSVYAPIYTVIIKDPEYKVLNKQDVKTGQLKEKDSALAKIIFNRLQRCYKSGR